MIHYENIKIVSIREDDGYYNNKKKKYVYYKEPKITKTTVFEDKHCYDLGELYENIKFFTEKATTEGNKIEISFNTLIEY